METIWKRSLKDGISLDFFKSCPAFKKFTQICKCLSTASWTAVPGFYQSLQTCRCRWSRNRNSRRWLTPLDKLTQTSVHALQCNLVIYNFTCGLTLKLDYNDLRACSCVLMLSHMPAWVCGPSGNPHHFGSRLRPLWETLSDRTGMRMVEAQRKFFLGHSQPFPEISGFSSSSLGSRSSSSPTGQAGVAAASPGPNSPCV